MDLLEQHRREGRRFKLTEVVERGTRAAVGLDVTDPHREGTGRAFKVFTFREADGRAVLLQDCAGREDALAILSAE